jgi:hypothetical protein
MTTTADKRRLATQPTENHCADCRFGAGLPQGAARLMRCVNPGYPTAGQFLRGPLACEGFQMRPLTALGADTSIASPASHSAAA